MPVELAARSASGRDRRPRAARAATSTGLLLAASLALWAGCRATSAARPADAAARTAMQRVLRADEEAAARRDEAPRGAPVAEAVRAYVAELDALDYGGCPSDFVAAFRSHRDAWAGMGEHLAPFTGPRGEMHAVFDRLGAEGQPGAAEFQRRLDAIWSTWGAVEASLERHGVTPANGGG
jgi:hypothetical protein